MIDSIATIYTSHFNRPEVASQLDFFLIYLIKELSLIACDNLRLFFFYFCNVILNLMFFVIHFVQSFKVVASRIE